MLLKRKGVQIWARRLHIYISMALLLIVLFFSVTGITLNRPEWFESSQPNIEQQTAMIPNEILKASDNGYEPNEDELIDFLTSDLGLRGSPSNLDVFTSVEAGKLIEGEASLDFKGPGYNASVYIDLLTGKAEIESTNYGVVALLNDLHKGRNSGEVWKWFIDITALLMIFFVLTGVCLLLPKKKTLNTSLKWTAFGSIITLSIFYLAVP